MRGGTLVAEDRGMALLCVIAAVHLIGLAHGTRFWWIPGFTLLALAGAMILDGLLPLPARAGEGAALGQGIGMLCGGWLLAMGSALILFMRPKEAATGRPEFPRAWARWRRL